MIGIILITIGSFFREISDSIGKTEVKHHKESLFTMAFLNLIWAAIFFIIICVIKNDAFIFNLASWPTFTIRAFLEIVQTYISVLAIVKANRSTYGFVRTITIPLLLLVDFTLGYKIGFFPIIGMLIIMFTILILFLNDGFSKKGVGFVVFSAVNAVATISLFKYDITYYNSVVAEQLFMTVILLIFFIFFALIKGHENPFIFLKQPIFFLQSFSFGIGGVIQSFAYNYGAASIINAAERSLSIFWSLVSGKVYFAEKNMILKFIIFILLLAGLILFAL